MFQPFQPVVLIIGIILGLFTQGVVTNKIPEDKAGCVGLSTVLTFPATIFMVLASFLAWPLALLSAVIGTLAVFFKWVHEYDMEIVRSHYR